MKHLEKATDLNQLINSGKLMEGFEKYYHQDLVMQEVVKSRVTEKIKTGNMK